MLHRGLPEGVERLIHEFASGWRPTPSAAALQKVLRRGGVVDKHATTRCSICKTSKRCPREWHFLDDGAVQSLYHYPESSCAKCWDISECEFEDGEEVCEGWSAKSTWETCWEQSTGEKFYDYRHKELRAYVRDRLNAYD